MHEMASRLRALGWRWKIRVLGSAVLAACVAPDAHTPAPAPVASERDAPAIVVQHASTGQQPLADQAAGGTGAAGDMQVALHAPDETGRTDHIGFAIREYPRRPVAATFEVGPTSALVWAYAPEPTEARIELEYAGPYRYGHSGSYQRVSTHLLNLAATRGNTGVHKLDRLQSDGAYRYRLQFGNGDGTDWYYLRTAPAADADAAVHFVFGADISNDPRYASPMLTTMSHSGAAFLVSLGDWPYTDLPVRDRTLEQYRASHRLARLQADTRRLASVLPMYAIYDDHEVSNDWNGEFVARRQKRALAALRAWDEFFPVSERDTDPLMHRRYRSFQWGKHAQFFVLDTRRYRSPHKHPNGPEKTMLGREQWQWLLSGLGASKASFKIIVTSVPMDLGTTREHWNAYPDERDALYGFIADRKISGVVFLTADQHWLAVHELPSGHREYQVGPLRSFLRKPPDPAPAGALVQIARPNYGEIVITPGPAPQLVFAARDQDGALMHADVIQPGRGQRPAPAGAPR